MAIKLGGGGGANIPYVGSTAEVAYTPVSEGTLYNLNSSGKLVPPDPVLSSTGELDQTFLAVANGGTTTTAAVPFLCGQYEGQMANGNILYAFSNYISSSSMGIGLVVLDSSGNQLSYLSADFGTYYNAGNYYGIESMGDNSTHYIFTAFLKGQASGNSTGRLRGLILTVRKSDNVITAYYNSALLVNLNSTTNQLTNEMGGSLQLARDRSVYCALMVVGGSSTTNITYELSSGTVSSTYAQAEQTTTSISNVYSGRNIQLIKYDDSSANFLLAYHTGSSQTTGYTIKKVLVAADGTHTVTDITPAALSQGTGGTQQQAKFTKLYKSEDKSKFLLMSLPQLYEARYQKTSYDGSTLTVGSFQKYLSTGNASFFKQSQAGAFRSYASNSLIYRYAADKLYLTAAQAHANWSDTNKGAVWTLGSGSVTGTAVETSIFDSFLTDGPNYNLISIDSNGLITERTYETNAYLKGYSSLVFDESPVTLNKIAYARQSGDIGDTVNISLIEGVTSSDTLSSAYWLNKENMYYQFAGVSSVPAAPFGYLKMLSNHNVSITAANVNATTLGEDVVSIVAPDGKYLIVYRYESTTSNNSATSTGVKVDGNSIYTGLNQYNTTFDNSQLYGRKTTDHPPDICKTFSLYRSSTSTENAASAVYYYIGEPA